MAQYLDKNGLQTVAGLIKDKYYPKNYGGILKLEPGGYDVTTGEPMTIMSSFIGGSNQNFTAYRTEKFKMYHHMTTGRLNEWFGGDFDCILFAWKPDGTYVGCSNWRSVDFDPHHKTFDILDEQYANGSEFTYYFGAIDNDWWKGDYVFSIVLIPRSKPTGSTEYVITDEYLQLIGDGYITDDDVRDIFKSVFGTNAVATASIEETPETVEESGGIGSFD